MLGAHAESSAFTALSPSRLGHPRKQSDTKLHRVSILKTARTKSLVTHTPYKWQQSLAHLLDNSFPRVRFLREISGTAQSQPIVLREAQHCEVCTFNLSCLCHYTVQCKYDFVQNIPNLATVMFNLRLNCWLKNSTRVGARDEQTRENQNEFKNSCAKTERRKLHKRPPDSPSLPYFQLNVQ